MSKEYGVIIKNEKIDVIDGKGDSILFKVEYYQKKKVFYKKANTISLLFCLFLIIVTLVSIWFPFFIPTPLLSSFLAFSVILSIVFSLNLSDSNMYLGEHMKSLNNAYREINSEILKAEEKIKKIKYNDSQQKILNM